MTQNQGIPGWAKAIIAIAAVGTGLYIAYYAITNIFSAGVNAYKELYQQQYNNLLQKMANYVKQNAASNTGFTASQQDAIAVEQRALAQTQQGLAAAANGLNSSMMWTIIGVATVTVIGAVGFAALKTFINAKYGNKPASVYGYTYSVSRVIADELTQMGYPTQAANLVTSAQQMFQQVDMPAMQEQVASLSTSLATLTGVELLAAQQMINLISLDISIIPDILVTPILI